MRKRKKKYTEGIVEVPGVTTLSYRNSKGEKCILQGSRSFQLRIKRTDENLLAENKFNRREGQKFFRWIIENVPAGIYEVLFKLMVNEENKMRE